MEQELDVQDLFADVALEESTSAPDAVSEDHDDGAGGRIDGGEVNDSIKEALRQHLENPGLTCLVVDLVDPGSALEAMRLGWVTRMEPWQHALVAFALIAGVAVGTNPGLREQILAVAHGRRALPQPEASP